MKRSTLDGRADAAHWWPWKRDGHPQSQRPDRDRLFGQAEAGVPVSERVYGDGHYLRPQFIQPYRCENVLIEDALFDTGDDCIAIKSGRNADGRRLAAPAERIVVRGCRMRAGHGGVTIGSEVSGVYVRDVAIGETGAAIDVDMLYEEGAAGGFTPVVRELMVERLSVRSADYALFIRGLPGSPVRSVLLRDSVLGGVRRGSRLEHVAELVLQDVTILPAPRQATQEGTR